MFKGPQVSELGVFFKVSDLLLSNDLLMSFDTKEKFNDYLTYLYGTNIVTNHLLECDYSFSPTFSESSDDNLGGVGLQYGNGIASSTPVLLEISDLTLPKQVYFSFRYANPYGVMCFFDISFRTSKNTYSLITVTDDQYDNSGGYYAHVYTDNKEQVNQTFAHGTYHFNVSLDVANDCPNCFTDGDTTGSLIISSVKNVSGYNTNPVFIKELNILFA